MKASICMASFNRDPELLRRVLRSIYSQKPPFEFEVIITDDGSEYGAPDVRDEFPVQWHRIEREPIARNASVARNVAYRHAKGDIIIAQSDDVEHRRRHAIERLCGILEASPGTFVIARVLGCNEAGEPYMVYSGRWKKKRRRAPYFFLGALWRKDLYGIGGDDEEFTHSGGQNHEDRWFADCLLQGRNLLPIYTNKVTGHHLWHATRWVESNSAINKKLYIRKCAEANESGVWCSSSGPWSDGNG